MTDTPNHITFQTCRTFRKVLVKKNVGMGSPNFGKVPYRMGENMNLYADIKKAKKLLKWAPSISIEDGIRQTINFQISKK